ncbi:MAG: hypothetical protein HY219_01820 [Candidatus Staskawiczbacteria bacterium]|nr:hypothetical protein [Candidatus Staskawiczbacteria bacterium]
MRKVAIFDIDGTIFRSSLLIEVVEALVEDNIFPLRVKDIYIESYKNWSNRKDSYEKYIMAVVKSFEKNIKGVAHSQAVKKEKLTLKDSVGVGDTESDIPFLSLVQNPICFNPNNKLYAHAKKSKWQVVVERKDVIYFLKDNIK